MIQWHFKTFDDLTKQEIYQIIQLRIAVFVVEQNAHYQDCDGIDFKSQHLFATKNNKIVAYCRIIPAGISYREPSVGRVVVSPEHRRKGYGRILLDLALETMKTLNKTTDCKISAQLYLQEFYESFGFQQISDVYLEDGLEHIKMLK